MPKVLIRPGFAGPPSPASGRRQAASRRKTKTVNGMVTNSFYAYDQGIVALRPYLRNRYRTAAMT
jgi:hypothetical protein